MALVWALLATIAAVPIIFIAALARIKRPSDMASDTFARLRNKQIGNAVGGFFFTFYFIGGLISIGLAVIAAIGFAGWFFLTKAPYNVSGNAVVGAIWIYYAVWWIVSLVISIQSLPDSIE